MGIECAAFIDPVDDELCCAICTDVFDAPVVACKELHTFCGECLYDVRKSPNPRCPSCREPLPDTCTANRPLANMIAKKQTRCPNSIGRDAAAADHDSDGDQNRSSKKARLIPCCEWTGPCSELRAHRAQCAEEMVTCTDACGRVIRRKEMPEHLSDTCERRRVGCGHCGLPFLACRLAFHAISCPKKIVTCSRKCGASFRLEKQNSHKSSCPREPVPCPFARFGCNVLVARCDLAQHQADETSRHLMLSMNKVDSLEKELVKSQHVIESMPKPEALNAMETKLASLQRLVEKKLGGVDEPSFSLTPRTGSKPEVERKFDGLERDIGGIQTSVEAIQANLDHPSVTVHWEIDAHDIDPKKDGFDLCSQTVTLRDGNYLKLRLLSPSKDIVCAYVEVPSDKQKSFPILIGGSEIRVRACSTTVFCPADSDPSTALVLTRVPSSSSALISQVRSSRGADLLVTFDDTVKLEVAGPGRGSVLAKTRAILRSKVKDGKLTIEAKLCCVTRTMSGCTLLTEGC